jgi:hypothetical protein
MPKMKKLLEDARARGMFVVYSVALPNTGEKDMMPEIAPKAGEPILPPLGPDKFLNSDFGGIVDALWFGTDKSMFAV